MKLLDALSENLMVVVVVVALCLWVGAMVIAGFQVHDLSGTGCEIKIEGKVTTLTGSCHTMPTLFNTVGNTLGTAFTSALGAVVGVSVVYGAMGLRVLDSPTDTPAYRAATVCVGLFLIGLVVASVYSGWRLLAKPEIELALPSVMTNAITTLLGLSTAIIASVVARNKQPPGPGKPSPGNTSWRHADLVSVAPGDPELD